MHKRQKGKYDPIIARNCFTDFKAGHIYYCELPHVNDNPETKNQIRRMRLIAAFEKYAEILLHFKKHR